MRGKFVSEKINEPQRVFVFAAFRSSFTEVVDQFRTDPSWPDLAFIWIREEQDLRELTGVTNPYIVLPVDYKENSVTDDFRFRQLISTGTIDL